MRHLICLLSGLLCLNACEPSPPAEPPAPVSTTARAIVGGAAEAGWMGVGALTYDSFNTGYTGSFCTGALINSRWVLTASHCIEGLRSEGLQVRPSNVYFYVGPDARPTRQGAPDNGSFYAVQAIHLHPGYDPDDYVALYDIALLELDGAANGVPTYPYFAGDLSPYVGDDVFYVGYGVSDGARGTGGGVKRSTTLSLATVGPGAFVTSHGNSGVCQGDSGGPAFVRIGGLWQIVGVNNSVAGEPPCLGFSIQIQTSTYDHWIQRTMGAADRCGANTCSCPEACGADGVCDELACNRSDACGQIFNCFNSCQGEGCEFTCYADGSEEGRGRFDTAIQCMQANCANAADYQACVEQRCGEEIDLCFDAGPPPPPGDEDCETLLSCVNSCGDSACQQACYADGTAAAREQYDTLIQCVFDRCDGLSGEAFNACAYDRCGDLWAACIPGDGCDVSGGDCGPGAACIPSPWPSTACEPSNDRGLDDLCNPQVVDCADGLLCIDVGFGTRCASLCTAPEDCEGLGAACDLLEDVSITMGVCDCEDADRDGACATQDCDDRDSTRRPGVAESCDGEDDDCDGEIDEMCGQCEPADEVCDQSDNDCDGAVDEGCEPVCEPADEVCDDADNDCDGIVDEGCGAGGAGGEGGALGGAPNPGGAGGAGGDDPPPTINRVSRGGGSGGCNTGPSGPTGLGALFGLLMLIGLRRR